MFLVLLKLQRIFLFPISGARMSSLLCLRQVTGVFLKKHSSESLAELKQDRLLSQRCFWTGKYWMLQPRRKLERGVKSLPLKWVEECKCTSGMNHRCAVWCRFSQLRMGDERCSLVNRVKTTDLPRRELGTMKNRIKGFPSGLVGLVLVGGLFGSYAGTILGIVLGLQVPCCSW